MLFFNQRVLTFITCYVVGSELRKVRSENSERVSSSFETESTLGSCGFCSG